MDGIGRLAKIVVVATLLMWLVPLMCTVTIRPDEIGVRQSNFSGVSETDIEPGWAWRVPGMHRILVLPKRFAYLDYTSDEVGPQQPLQIRTKDNNIVMLDVSVPYRIKLGDALFKAFRYADALAAYREAKDLGHPQAEGRIVKAAAKLER